MPRPRIVDYRNYMSSRQVCEALGISFDQLLRRLDQGILPAPTKLGSGGLRLFDENWLRIAKAVIRSSVDAKAPEASP